jgi:hypothetical protein
LDIGIVTGIERNRIGLTSAVCGSIVCVKIETNLQIGVDFRENSIMYSKKLKE